MSFRPILSTIKLAKFGVHILKSLSGNVQDSFAFAEEIVEQDSDFFLGSLDLDSLYTNILLEEAIDICANILFEKMEKSRNFIKIEI